MKQGHILLSILTSSLMLIPCTSVTTASASPHLDEVSGQGAAFSNSDEHQQLPAAENLLKLDWTPVGIAELAVARGGFLLPGNVQIDIGFESGVMIDGVLRSQTKLFLDNLSSGQLNSAGGIPSTGTGFQLPLSQIVQNSMDNQVIESLKVLDIKFSNLGPAQFGPLHQLMKMQLVESLR